MCCLKGLKPVVSYNSDASVGQPTRHPYINHQLHRNFTNNLGLRDNRRWARRCSRHLTRHRCMLTSITTITN